MRNFVYMGILALVLAFAVPVGAQEVELTGNAWLESSQDEKASFLLGVEMAFATEFHLAQRTAAKDKKSKNKMQSVNPSSFARGWMTTFKDTTRPQLITKIDNYLITNPSERERHLFDIIWYEFIAPQTKKARDAGGK